MVPVFRRYQNLKQAELTPEPSWVSEDTEPGHFYNLATRNIVFKGKLRDD